MRPHEHICERRCREGMSHRAFEVHFWKCYQKTVYKQLVASEEYDGEDAIRKTLVRWRISQVPQGTLARRSVNILRLACSLTSTRVAGVLLRTWCNGLCSARRSQNTGRIGMPNRHDHAMQGQHRTLCALQDCSPLLSCHAAFAWALDRQFARIFMLTWSCR